MMLKFTVQCAKPFTLSLYLLQVDGDGAHGVLGVIVLQIVENTEKDYEGDNALEGLLEFLHVWEDSMTQRCGEKCL